MNTNPWPTFKNIALRALRLVNKNPQLIVAAVLVSLVSVFGSALSFLPLAIVIMVGAYVWNFVQIDLLSQRQNNQTINWKKLPQLFGQYFKKSWPLMLIMVVFLYGLTFLFFLISKVGTLDSLFYNPVTSSVMGLVLDLATTVVSLWFIQTVILVVVKEKKILKALPEAGLILYQNATFFIMLTLILEALGLADRYLFQLLPENNLTYFAFLIYNAYLSLLTSAIVLVHFSHSKK